MPINSSSIAALRVARAVKKRKRAEGGLVYDPLGMPSGADLERTEPEALPNRAMRGTIQAVAGLPKAVMWDLPHRAVEHASQTAPGLRREDFTDIPADTSPDPRSPLGGIGVKVPRFGAQPVDPLVGDSLEAGMNVMGGVAVGAPAGAAGAGPARLGKAVADEGRLARAAEQGFDTSTPVYHGTSKDTDFKKFKDSRHGTWTTTDPAEASMYAKNNDSKGYVVDHAARGFAMKPVNTADRVLPLYAKPLQNPYVMKEYPESLRTATNYKKAQSEWFDDLKRAGHDGVIMPNGVRVDFDNANLRGQFAPFEPKNAGKSMILGAGAADKRAGAAATMAEIDRVLAAEQAAKGVANEPAAAAAAAPERAAAADPGAVGPGGGGPTGTRSLPEAQATAARWAGERKPLEGIPGPLKIGEDYFVPGPIGKIHDVAEEYMRGTGRAYNPPTRFHPIDPEHSAAIAKAFDEMKHTPKDPATVASYNALIDETAAQYQAIKKTGLKIEPIPPGAADPYAANPRLAAIDVAENNHLWFFPTEGGFGTVNKISDNPMLRKTGEKIGDHELLANDMFRIVHDYFGHLKQGHGFRAAGEDNAWRSHSAMYSDLARPAMTTETRGQNSWVNYGPHGEKNRTASGADTVYADQKVGLMPDWTMYDRGKEPIYAYHGSPHSFDKFKMSKMGSGEGNQVYGNGLYFAENPKVAQKYRKQLATNPYTLNGSPVPWTHIADDIASAIDKVGPIDRDLRRNIIHEVTTMMDRGKSPKQIAGNYAEYPNTAPYWKAAIDAISKYQFSRKPGASYKVALERPPEQFLDWDATLANQSDYIKERVAKEMAQSVAEQKVALEKKIERLTKGPSRYPSNDRGRMLHERDLRDAKFRLETLDDQWLKGSEIYKRMGLPAHDQEQAWKQATQALRDRDVPGLRYFDEGSRIKGQGTRNYVAFTDDIIRILRKYGITAVPAAGVAAGAAADRERAAGGRIHKAGGGAFGVFSPGEQAEIDDVKPMQVEPEPDRSPVLFRTPSGIVITERDLQRGMDIGMGAATTTPVRRIADEAGAALTTARHAKRYAEPEFTPGGARIINRGVESAPDPAIQTVADPYRMMFPGIYRDPRIIAAEAAERVGPEEPMMKRLWGVNRGELREMAQGRVGNEDPRLYLAKNPKGSLAAQNIQTPQNTQRLLDILHEGGKYDDLRTADAWYIMDPVYRRLVEMGVNDPRAAYKHLNTLTGMASPGSDVTTEIARGTAAHWLDKSGRFGDFQKYAGIPEELRGRVQFPADMRRVPGHPYHRTSQSDPMAKYIEAGEIQSKNPKVPLYVHASGVPETGFQTSGPVGDAHFSRGVGLADTRKGPTDVGSSFSTAEYQTLQPWWQHEVAGAAGLESVPAQARLWTVLGPQTGVESALGAPKLELLTKQIMEAAQRLRISPEKARDLVLSGKAGAFMRGGAVDAAMSVARSIKRAKGGKVHVGPIMGPTGGRADKVPMKVPNGAYVLTADHVSGLGEGNTEAGMKRLSEMFPKSKPSRMRNLPDAVPIYAADGEFVISPEDIVDRFGDLEYGHKALDEWQTQERQRLIETLQNLAPPAQD